MNFFKVSTIFSVLFIFSHGFKNNFTLKQSKSNESVVLSQIIANYLIRYFNADETFVSFVVPPSKRPPNYFNEDFFSNLFNNPILFNFDHDILNTLRSTFSNKHSFNLILIDDSEYLSDILNAKTVQEQHLAEKYLIIVTEKRHNVADELDKLFGLLWKNALIDSHVLSQDENELWSLYEFMPFHSGCSVLKRQKIESFNHMNYTETINLTIDELYPQKLKNFNKCPIYVAAAQIIPFIIPHISSDGSIRYEGIDISIIEQISKHFNFSISYKLTYQGSIFSNGSANENMKMVMGGEANLTIGGVTLAMERSVFLTPSHPILQACFVFAYKERDAYVHAVTRLLSPFQFSVWLSIGGTLIVVIIIILLTKKLETKWRHFLIGGRRNRTPILNMWSVIIGNPISNSLMANKRFFGTFARTLAVQWIILWLVIRNSYQSGLYKYLQGQRFISPYDTVDKVQSSDITIITTPSLYLFVHHLIKQERVLIRNTEFSGLLKSYYDDDDSINAVVLTNDLSMKYFNLMLSSNRLGFTKDCLFTYNPVFYFQKPSLLSSLFNKELLKYHRAGLTEYWAKQYVDNRKERSHQMTPTKLKVENILAAFQICAILYLISFMVFILEVISRRYLRVRYVVGFFTY